MLLVLFRRLYTLQNWSTNRWSLSNLISKGLDKVNWSLLRLTLLQIGLYFDMVKWMMSCVTTTNFAVFINGTPSKTFKVTQGIRQGCPLSPYLFLLIIEGLSLLIAQAKADRKIIELKVTGSIYLTHILFLDDVILFGDGSLLEWIHYKSLINLFCRASGMTVSPRKYSFGFLNIVEDTIRRIGAHFSYP